LDTDARVVPDRAVGGRDAVEASLSRRGKECSSALSGLRPAPAAAIICGLRGLDAELARLPFLEWWIPMPWTIDVCL
jgi:hypothetical protein